MTLASDSVELSTDDFTSLETIEAARDVFLYLNGFYRLLAANADAPSPEPVNPDRPRPPVYQSLQRSCTLVKELLEDLLFDGNFSPDVSQLRHLVQQLQISFGAPASESPQQHGDQPPQFQYRDGAFQMLSTKLLALKNRWWKLQRERIDVNEQLHFIDSIFNFDPYDQIALRKSDQSYQEWLKLKPQVLGTGSPDPQAVSAEPTGLFKFCPWNVLTRKAAQAISDELSACHCKSTRHQFSVQLRLGKYHQPSHISTNKDLYPVLDVFLSERSIGPKEWAGRKWRELSMLAEAQIEGAAEVQHQMSPISPNSPESQRESKKIKRLCKRISEHQHTGTKMQLELVQGECRSHKPQTVKSDTPIDLAEIPTSLAELLSERSHDFQAQMRSILNLLLSYAVLHLYGTPWLGKHSTWSSSDILFSSYPGSGRVRELRLVPRLKRPFADIQMQQLNINHDVWQNDRRHLYEQDSASSETGDSNADSELSSDSSHPYPVMINLAIMLMEVTFFRTYADLAIDCGGTIAFGENESDEARLVSASTVSGHFRHQMESELYYVIKKCLEREAWAGDDDSFRARLYANVIRPLEVQLRHRYVHIPLQSLDDYAQKLSIKRMYGTNKR